MIKGSAPLPVVVATLMSVACASGQIAPATTGGAPIVIGAVLPLTGEVALFGASALNSMRLAVDEANAAGGALGRPLELRARDDKGDATEGAAAYRASIEIDGAIAIAGAVMSKISLAGAPICQARGVPMVSPTSTNPRVTEVGDYIFRTAFIDPFQGTMAATASSSPASTTADGYPPTRRPSTALASERPKGRSLPFSERTPKGSRLPSSGPPWAKIQTGFEPFYRSSPPAGLCSNAGPTG